MTSSPPLVALAAWLLPGAGYVLIGQRGRGLVSGITIIVLFMAGLLIGGVRVIEVPGFDVQTGEQRMVTITAPAVDPNTHKTYLDRNGNEEIQAVMVPMIDPATGQPVIDPSTGSPKLEALRRWVLVEAPLSEIRDKPWSVPQILAGPIAIAAGAWSVHAASIDPSTAKTDPGTGKTIPATSIGPVTHARINEIASLYLSVAGLLNLMVIIDAAWRASHMGGQLLGAEATA